jgi:cytochrome c biogenesis DsbD-like protein
LKIRRVVASCLFGCWAASLGLAQNPPSVVEAKVVMASDAAYPDSLAKAAVVAQVASGYHINDHKPSADYLIPTELKVEPIKQVTVKEVVYPKGTVARLAFSDTPLSVYEGTVVVGALLQLARGVAPGTYTLAGKFGYQACNDHACLPPTSVPVSFNVKVVSRKVPLKPLNADVFQRVQFE